MFFDFLFLLSFASVAAVDVALGVPVQPDVCVSERGAVPQRVFVLPRVTFQGYVMFCVHFILRHLSF